MSQASQGGIPAGDKASAMAGQTWIHAMVFPTKKGGSPVDFSSNQSNDRYVICGEHDYNSGYFNIFHMTYVSHNYLGHLRISTL